MIKFFILQYDPKKIIVVTTVTFWGHTVPSTSLVVHVDSQDMSDNMKSFMQY